MQISKIKNKYAKVDGSMYGEKNIAESLAVLYHENSKFTSYSSRIQGEKISAFNYNPYVIKRSSQPFKYYPNHKKIDLSVYPNAVENVEMRQICQ